MLLLDREVQVLVQPNQSRYMVIELSEHQLYTGIRNPTVLARQILAQATSPTPERTPRSPQRPLFKAVVRRYFKGGRLSARARVDLEARIQKAKRRERLASQFANCRTMIGLFLSWDAKMPSPVRYVIEPTPADVLGWTIRVGHDHLSDSPDGLVLRQLVTDGSIMRAEHLRLFAVASLLHYEAANPGVELAAVEVWQLRAGKRFTWTRRVLRRLIPDLGMRLGQLAAALADDAA